jgi:hypothetical protein
MALTSSRNADRFLILPSVLRERYLRNHVDCGVSGYKACVQPARVLLPYGDSAESKPFLDGPFVVPGTNIP